MLTPHHLTHTLTHSLTPRSRSVRSKDCTGPVRWSIGRTRRLDWWRFAVLVAVYFITMVCGYANAQLGGGSGVKCTNEGEEVYVAGISDDPCISCYCMAGEVSCRREQCPNMVGCHTILFQPNKLTCCDTCKGCYYAGVSYNSGDEWVSRSNSCQYYKCQAGVVTTSFKQCQVTCSNPHYIPGQCCPVCSGCSVGGNTYMDGETFPSPRDTCSQCSCQNGSVQCERAACPVLNCLDIYINTPPGSCCPVCTGTRQVFDLGKKACLFRNEVQANGISLLPDNCTSCMCQDGTMVCTRKVCPPITCARGHYVIYDKSTCCPRCERPKRSCKYKDKKYKDAKEWQPDECTTCSCNDGLVRCQVNQCTNEIITCAQNTKLQYVPGKCCPECVDNDAVCTVFGDPHYRTFDGSIYNFQGTCNYILARDCITKDFSVHVRNDARLTNDFAWTKSVSIRLRDTRIYLLQNNRVKVNRKRVSLPYENRDVAISGSRHTVSVKTAHGVKLIWDGDSYLEVSVPPTYKHKMCGLCGNYNNTASDDLTGRDGVLYLSAPDFGETWRVGKRLLCASGSQAEKKSSCDSRDERRQARKQCSVFVNGVFELCNSVVDAAPYHESCMTDVCDCDPSRKCACESIRAYVRECQRNNVQLEWSPKLCQDRVCEANSRWSACADPCPRRCAKQKSTDKCRTLCTEGCECQSGYVLHGGKCVKPGACPAGKQDRHRSKKKKRKKGGKKAVVSRDNEVLGEAGRPQDDGGWEEGTVQTGQTDSSDQDMFGKDLFNLLSGREA